MRTTECACGMFEPHRTEAECVTELARQLAAAEARCAETAEARDEWERLYHAKEARCAELRGAMAADDGRLREAAIRVWGEDRHGCDTPDWMAEKILTLRARCAELERLLDPAVTEAARYMVGNAAKHPHACCLKCSAAIGEAESRIAELEIELDDALAEASIHAGEHKAQMERAARYRYVIEREIVFYEEEAACGATFYEGTFQQRAAALRAALAGGQP